MDSLKQLITNVPDWERRLDDLNSQIDQRQLELAKFAGTTGSTKSTKSIRNQGSTESLKPNDDGPAYPTPAPAVETPAPAPTPLITNRTPPTSESRAPLPRRGPPSSPVSDPKSNTSAFQRQKSEVVAAAQRRVRATLAKRQKTPSMMSAEGAPPRYRSRVMVIVYYDSYVQSFFEELVKFVSASRNLMRKAKMAAKVAQIKRLAELEMPDEDENDGNPTDLKVGDVLSADGPKLEASDAKAEEPDLKLQYTRARQMRPMVRTVGNGPIAARGVTGLSKYGVGKDKPDIYDDLDKGLEYVQSTCEHAAHQFLRDGECSTEIENIKLRLTQTKALADKEMERILKEDPDALTREAAPPARTRSFRPMQMRKDPGASSPKPMEIIAASTIEVDDEGVQDMDDFIRPVYKSTRLMRGHTAS